MIDEDINFAVIKINSRSPKNGYQVNTECKELLYIINGNGTVYNKQKNEKFNFEKGDVVMIQKK